VRKIYETCVRYLRWLFTTVAIPPGEMTMHVRRLLFIVYHRLLRQKAAAHNEIH